MKHYHILVISIDLLLTMELVKFQKILLSTQRLVKGKVTKFFFYQLKLLRYDNVISKNFATNSSIGIPAKKIFKHEVEKYCYMWRDGGQFSTEKYTSKDIENKTS